MGRYRGSSRNRSYGSRSVGREKALEHIREAEALSRELGGTDKDVKEYFFSLSNNQFQDILNIYEQQHGKQARDYAEKTLLKWKSGKVHMSGMVAERLFSLLPPTMPIESKFKLTESLWKHVGPSSSKTYYIGLDVDVEEISQRVKKHLSEVVTHYEIPSTMELRFNWLSQGDIEIKQQLLNYFRQQEKTLLSNALSTQLPVLLNHLQSDKGNLTTHTAQVLKVGKHEVRVEINEQVNGVSETAPARPDSQSNNSWIWWIIGIIILLFFLNK
jgi:hypothetical protein